jgi:hypothetical protein
MSEVKRYYWRFNKDSIISVEEYEHADGDYVHYSDYEAIKRGNADLTSRIASLEREKEDARDKVLDECSELAFEIASDFARDLSEHHGARKHAGAFAVGERIRAMKGAKP